MSDQKNLNKRISILTLKTAARLFNIFFTHPRNIYTNNVITKTAPAKNI